MSIRPTAASSVRSAAAAQKGGEGEEEEPVIAGPYSLYHGSFILEFLQPKPSRNASVLMRATYKQDHPLCRKGKGHPQSPPLHLHFQQSESFTVLSGEVGTTTSYSQIDAVHTAQNTPASNPHHIPPWMPHRFWPSPTAKEDTTILVWAHPNPRDMDDKMDRIFFQNLLMYVSDVSEGKESFSLLQVMLMQHISATALIMLPGLWFLGPLRWWIPWLFQYLCAYIGLWMGKKPLLKKYMSVEDWEDEDVQERIGMWKKKDL